MESNDKKISTEPTDKVGDTQQNTPPQRPIHNPFAIPMGSCTPAKSQNSGQQTSESQSSPFGSCACQQNQESQGSQGASSTAPQGSPVKPAGPSFIYTLVGAIVVGLWYMAIAHVVPISVWVTYTLFGLEAGTALASAVEFFVYDVAKILLLLIAMVYVIAVLRASLNVERVRTFLQGRGKLMGHILAAIFGSITPFCSCSSIPLFLGFTTAGIPVGVTMSFLITSPIINEVAVVLLGGLLGWKFTIAYVVVGITAGVLGGYFMSAIQADRWFQPEMKNHLRLVMNSRGLNPVSSLTAGKPHEHSMTLWDRHLFGLDETLKIFRKVWVWVIVGVGVGAALHGYVPETWITDNLHAGQWWTVPVAVAAGIPLYGSATGIVPVMESLLLKGLPMGTTLALCMSTIAISLPELLMLRQVMQVRLLFIFAALMFVLFTLVGWLFNVLAPFMA